MSFQLLKLIPTTMHEGYYEVEASLNDRFLR